MRSYTFLRKFLPHAAHLYHFQRRLVGHASQITRLALSPNGDLLASGSTDQSVKIWDTNMSQCLHTLAQSDLGWGQITALKWLRDPKYEHVLAIGTGRGYIIFYQATSNVALHIYSEVVCRNIPIEDFDFDVATRQLIVADHSGRVWSFILNQDFHLGTHWMTELSPRYIVRNVRFDYRDEGNNVLAFVLNTGKCVALDSAKGIVKDEHRFSTAAGDVVFSPDSKQMLVDTLLSSFDLYNSQPFDKITSFKVSPARHLNKVKVGTFVEGGSAVACPNYFHNTVYIYKTTSPSAIDRLWHDQVRIASSHSAPTHHTICTGGAANGDIYVWHKRISNDEIAEPYSLKLTFQTVFNLVTIALLAWAVSGYGPSRFSALGGVTFSTPPAITTIQHRDHHNLQGVTQPPSNHQNLPVKVVSPLTEKLDITTTLTSTVVISVLASPTTISAPPSIQPASDSAETALSLDQHADTPGAFILVLGSEGSI
ncbi:WD40-repeat-containing domain protein [Coprinopsis sp. MPI-PUGE-AT-0042]|nr:WD40-repeat-containing domain protein [Coprinopsis sp. MPI-PUGE-AT-0042]